MQQDISLSPLKANLIVTPLGLGLVVVMLLPYLRIWGLSSALDLGWLITHPLNLLLALGVIFVFILLHELLHAVGWVIFGRQPWNSVRFGIFWLALTPYTHLKVPIEVNAYRIGGALPGLVTGVLPYLVSLLVGSAGWLWLGILMTAAACGDWLVLWLLRHLPKGTLVQDHPSRVGCTVVGSKEL